MTLLLMLVLVAVVLTGLLWVGTLFAQGYFYTEPVEQLSWRAPAAAGVLTAFLALWCLLDVNTPGLTPQDVPYDTLFRFSPRIDMPRTPVKELRVVRKDAKEPVRYVLKKVPQGAGQVRSDYRESGTDRGWKPEGVQAILLTVDGEEHRFEPRAKVREGGYREFVDGEGWVMPEYENGPTGQPTRFLFGRLLANLFLNGFHLALWFVCLWLLLRFSWPHALGLGFVLWLVATLAVLGPLLSVAGNLAWSTPPPRSAALLLFPHLA